MVSKSLVSETAEEAQPESSQILTFLLNGQAYGLELIKVQEIRGFTQITPIPNLPAYIKGVMNLRGAVLPVVDMRLKFGMPAIEYTKFTVIIIVHSGGKSVGLVVDAVSDVLSAAASAIQPPPDFGEATENRFVQGLMKSGDHLVVLLDLDGLLAESGVTTAVASGERLPDPELNG
jgi:purine-binding chemotaxis protein CheW